MNQKIFWEDDKDNIFNLNGDMITFTASLNNMYM